MNQSNSLQFENDTRGVATLTMTRVEKHNAFDDVMIEELNQTFERVNRDSAIRVLVLRAAGRSFSAGADLNWMRRMANYDHQQNRSDAAQLAAMMQSLNQLKQPTVAIVEGACYGGGLGLVAACDIAVANDNAVFCLSEVRLGLIPAVISPYVIAAIGERQARRYFLSAEKFDAREAHHIGLVHSWVSNEDLAVRVEQLIEDLLLGAPDAQAAAKNLIRRVSQQANDAETIAETVEAIAAIRAGAEAKAGLSAFLEKRIADWTKADRTKVDRKKLIEKGR